MNDNAIDDQFHFNPRSLAGATTYRSRYWEPVIFQSTLPCGSDDKIFDFFKAAYISIHAPLRERHYLRPHLRLHIHFNPRSLAGATCALIAAGTPQHDFNPRSLAGATFLMRMLDVTKVFQSTLPCGSDRDGKLQPMLTARFQSTLPCGSDLHYLKIRNRNTNFNPRSLAGATFIFASSRFV